MKKVYDLLKLKESITNISLKIQKELTLSTTC